MQAELVDHSIVLALIIRTAENNYQYIRLALNRKEINLANGLFGHKQNGSEKNGENASTEETFVVHVGVQL